LTHHTTTMLQQPIQLPGDISPWPPVLPFSPEVQSGIEAAAELAFGPFWDTPMDELTPEEFACEFARYASVLV
jgi:hypothetical protein